MTTARSSMATCVCIFCDDDKLIKKASKTDLTVQPAHLAHLAQPVQPAHLQQKKKLKETRMIFFF